MEKILIAKYQEMGETERRKVKELLKDKHKNEESVEKISWLYKPDKPDAEEYLLGRRIDKAIEKDLEKESADKDAPGALFTEVMSRRAEMDMQVKMREDPLYAIRRKEEEERRKVMNNPVKMKQLMKVLEEKKEKSKKKKGKKKGKKKQRKSSSSSDESDDELLNKYLAIVEQKKKKSGLTEQKGHDGRRQEKHGSNGQTSSRSKCDSDVRNRSFSNEKKSLGEKLKSDRKRRESVHSDSEEGSDRERRTSRHRSEAGEQHKGRMLHNSKDDDDGKRFKKYGLNKARDDSSPEIRKRRRSNSREGRDARSRKSVSPVNNRRKDISPQPVKRKLTSEEMEKKRIEMMENARLRDEERQANIKRYKEEDSESEKKNQGKGGPQFIKPMILNHTEKSSVEERIKRNIYKIQRTTADLDKNFTKR